MSTIEPGTKPPPSTRSTSPIPDASRAPSALVTVEIGATTAAPAMAREAEGAVSGRARGVAIVSTSVFHAPHAGHWPAHFGELAAALLAQIDGLDGWHAAPGR